MQRSPATAVTAASGAPIRVWTTACAPATWEIWNEPYLQAFSYPQPDPGRYAAVVRAAVEGGRRASPKARFLFAAETTWTTSDGRGATGSATSLPRTRSRVLCRWRCRAPLHQAAPTTTGRPRTRVRSHGRHPASNWPRKVWRACRCGSPRSAGHVLVATAVRLAATQARYLQRMFSPARRPLPRGRGPACSCIGSNDLGLGHRRRESDFGADATEAAPASPPARCCRERARRPAVTAPLRVAIDANVLAISTAASRATRGGSRPTRRRGDKVDLVVNAWRFPEQASGTHVAAIRLKGHRPWREIALPAWALRHRPSVLWAPESVLPTWSPVPSSGHDPRPRSVALPRQQAAGGRPRIRDVVPRSARARRSSSACPG